ncbi:MULTISPECIES: M23 family metallopeptidase [Lysinibacillus]|uniref:M23 family metallopeptidase n=1 Tax=Lysinibacillus varians TaxID=1145276 RepID=A0ABY2TDT4_9BACI|nr:M23 family metallopeptidase [Lysinibacillus varians]TKI66480.1 M23 family metallopeptidase [Lysinibacillus varians]
MRVSSSEVTPQNFGMFFLQERFDEIYNQCHATFQEMVSNEQFNEIAQSFNANVQNYELFNKSTIAHYHQYVWLDDRQEKAIQVTMDSSNIIHSLLIKPYVVFPESDKKYSQNTYIMPIKEEWFVFWGGVNEFVNYHYAYEAQRYAYDLVIMKNDSTFKDSPNVNENYYAFNKEVTAPADGKVIKVVNHLEDNIPGEMYEMEPAGNVIIIEHTNHEYSMVAHLKKNSCLVQQGDMVKQGDVIALCGNSGNSSEAHIHFQVMDAPDLLNCQSLRIRFADGLEPIQGDVVK